MVILEKHSEINLLTKILVDPTSLTRATVYNHPFALQIAPFKNYPNGAQGLPIKTT